MTPYTHFAMSLYFLFAESLPCDGPHYLPWWQDHRQAALRRCLDTLFFSSIVGFNVLSGGTVLEVKMYFFPKF